MAHNYIVTRDEVPYQPTLRTKYKIMQAGLNVVLFCSLHYILILEIYCKFRNFRKGFIFMKFICEVS